LALSSGSSSDSASAGLPLKTRKRTLANKTNKNELGLYFIVWALIVDGRLESINYRDVIKMEEEKRRNDPLYIVEGEK